MQTRIPLPLAVACVIMALLAAPVIQAQTLSVSPSTGNVLLSDSVNLDVRLDNVNNVHGTSVQLQWDNTIVQYIKITEGDFLPGNNNGDGTTLLKNPGPGTTNTVTVDQAILGTGVSSGSGVLFTIRYKSYQPGTTPVTIASYAVRDFDNNNITVTPSSGSIVCTRPTTVFVDPAYTPSNTGGHKWQVDAFSTLAAAISAVNVGGTVTAGSFTYNETVTIAKNLTLMGGPTVQNVEIASSAVVTLGANLSISGTLTLTSGSILTGSNKVTIISNTAGAVVATNGTVNGTIERPIAALATGTYVFTEANTSLTPSVGQGAITVSFSAHPNTTPPNVSTGVPVLRYYSITPIGALTATLRLAYLESELNTISESNLSMFRWNSVAWVVMGGLPNTGSNYIELAGISEFSDWALGDITRPLPIQLASFTWTALAGSGIRLEWSTLSEINNYGFYIQKRPRGETAFIDIPGSFVAGHGTTVEPHSYSYVDAGVTGGVWEYRLKQVDLDNGIHYSDFIVVDAVNAVVEETPKEFALLQNYPNPFNPKTVVSYQLPVASDVRLAVYDLLGREVATLVNEWRPAGKYNVAFDASGLSSGAYLYKLESNGKSATRKLTLVR